MLVIARPFESVELRFHAPCYIGSTAIETCEPKNENLLDFILCLEGVVGIAELLVMRLDSVLRQLNMLRYALYPRGLCRLRSSERYVSKPMLPSRMASMAYSSC